MDEDKIKRSSASERFASFNNEQKKVNRTTSQHSKTPETEAPQYESSNNSVGSIVKVLLYLILLIPIALCLNWYFGIEEHIVTKSTWFGDFTYDENGNEKGWALWISIFVGLVSLIPLGLMIEEILKFFEHK